MQNMFSFLKIFRTTTQGSTVAFRSAAVGTRPKISTKPEGVHVHVSLTSLQPPNDHHLTLVQMDTFESPTSDKGSSLTYDAAGQIRGESYDPEAQVISDEFKRPPY
jgi:hypothetical protein